MYNIKQHHDYRVYIVLCGCVWPASLCQKALPPLTGAVLHMTSLFFFSSGTLRRTKDKSNLGGRIHCEGTQNRQLVHFEFHKCTKQGLPRGFETPLMERVLTALAGGSCGAAGTKRQPSWDSLLLEGPRRVLGRYRGAYMNSNGSTANPHTHISHTLCTEVPVIAFPFVYLSTVLWDYIWKLLVHHMLLRSTTGYCRKEGKQLNKTQLSLTYTFIVFVTDFGFSIIGNTAVINIPWSVCNTNWNCP